jgi:enterochelin esterase-like enzyme
MGRRALFAYGVQLFVVAFFASELMAPVRLDRENAFFQAAAVAIVWLLCLAYPRVEEWLKTRRPLAAAAALIVVLACGGGTPVAATPFAAPSASVASASGVTGSPAASATARTIGRGRVEKGTFRSSALGRTMQYWIYLPGGYDANTSARYATVYLLHGGGGDIGEWASYGVVDTADRLMGNGTIPPFIIVMPEGDQEYWVDHVIDKRTGANGEKWGTYTAKEVVPMIDSRYRTLARMTSRAVGGLSMGGHAAMQLPLNFPGIWGAIGAHSPSLRPEGDAPTYLGFGAEFAARDPLSLIKAKPDLARQYAWWIDDGDTDPWRAQATAIHDQLTQLGITHSWSPFVGGHELAYWAAHMEDYLRYYARALCPSTASCP